MIVRPRERIHNIRWKYKLKDLDLPPLKLAEGGDSVFNLEMPGVIVGEELETGTRKFTLFPNYIELYKYSKWVYTNTGLPPNLYETCPYFMKIHFDIDLGRDLIPSPEQALKIFDGDFRYNHILKPYLASILSVFSETFPSERGVLENLLVFEGHREDKISFHIVVDGYYLPCHECQEFSRLVVESVRRHNEFVSELADFSVYKKNQSFRLLMSSKRGKKAGAKKIYEGPPLVLPCGTFSRQSMIDSSFGEEAFSPEMLIPRVLPRSLISFTLGCTRLSMKIPEPPREKLPPVSLQQDEIDHILDNFSKKSISQTSDGRQAFKFTGVAGGGGILCLQREFKNLCGVCDREHESSDPFLTVSPNGDVFFHCRRAKDLNIPSRIYICNCRF